MSHAEDRTDDQRQLCERAHVSIYFTGGDGAVGDSEPLHLVPYGEIYRVGDEGVEGLDNDLTLASGAVDRMATVLHL